MTRLSRFLIPALPLTVVVALALLLIPHPAPAADGSPAFVASKQAKKYHRPSCRWAQKISPKNKFTFKSADEAVAAGYVPCKVCKPPMGVKK